MVFVLHYTYDDGFHSRGKTRLQSPLGESRSLTNAKVLVYCVGETLTSQNSFGLSNIYDTQRIWPSALEVALS